MRIGIDARAVEKTTDGIGRYAIELIKAFSQRNDPHQYVIFKNPYLDHSFKYDERFREMNISIRRYSLKEQLMMPRILKKEKLDIFHSLHFTLPLGYKGAQVMTVHDIMPVLFPWFFGTSSIVDYMASAYLSFLVRASLKKAVITIVDSEHTAMDLRTHYKLNGDQLSRIYLGIDHLNPSLLKRKIDVPLFLGFHHPFILTVTNFRPYKNTKRLIQAFALVNKIIPDLRLVVVGENPKYSRRTLGDLAEAERKNVHFLGFIDDMYLTALLSSAEAFVFPSSYEGFGFPVLEAMNHGTPVITSSVASLPEIGGKAVVYVNPNDIQDIANAIQTICTNKELQGSLREAGRMQSRKFRWQDTAIQTLRVYEKVLIRAS